MKKLSKVLVVLLAVFAFAGCSLKKSDSKDKDDSKNETEEKDTKTSTDNKIADTTSFIESFNEEREDASNILTCEQTSEGTYTSGEIIWEDEYLTKMAIKVKVPVDNVENYNEDLFNQLVELSLGEFKRQLGIDNNTNGAYVTVEGNYNEAYIIISVYVDINKADQTVLDNLQMSFADDDLEVPVADVKNVMENNGYTCKITR